MEQKTVRNVVARGPDRIWHWLFSMTPEIGVTICGANTEWRRAVRPGADFPLEMEPGDTICYACDHSRSFAEFLAKG